ncbi:hypothetical protein C2S51_036119 [Perilla frutescens var. frutescens]|nr:hypothetical protein C2S51_036119 [Perilla frutescens var. frutescens]
MAKSSPNQIVFAFLLILAVAVPISGVPFGPYRPIENPNGNGTVVKIAKFAVTEHNRLAGNGGASPPVVFASVVKAEYRVFAVGTDYKLIISAQDSKTYLANVEDSNPSHNLKLIIFGEFKP